MTTEAQPAAFCIHPPTPISLCVHTVLFVDIMLIEDSQGRNTHTRAHVRKHTQIMCQVSLWIEVTVTVEVMECSRDQ